jgi:hypothetical protein
VERETRLIRKTSTRSPKANLARVDVVEPAGEWSKDHASVWCGQMVIWMAVHMGGWDHGDQGWMMNGSMMGR